MYFFLLCLVRLLSFIQSLLPRNVLGSGESKPFKMVTGWRLHPLKRSGDDKGEGRRHPRETASDQDELGIG